MAKTLPTVIMVLETRMGFGASSQGLLEIDDGNLILTNEYRLAGATLHGGSGLRTMLRFQTQLHTKHIVSGVSSEWFAPSNGYCTGL